MIVPLYGFLQGDTIGLLVLASPEDTMKELAAKLRSAASVRVAPRDGGNVVVQRQVMPDHLTVKAAGLEPLDRFDVRFDVRFDGGRDMGK